MSTVKGVTVAIRKSNKTIKLRMTFDPTSHTLYDIKKQYCDQEKSSVPAEKIVLYRKGKELPDNNKKLKEYAFGRMTVLSMTTRVIGGALYIPNDQILNSNRNRRLDTSDPDVKSSIKPDCVYYTTDKPRAEMPCGHAYCCQTMFDLAKSVIKKNDYEFTIKCAAPNCNREFEFDLVAKVADMNDDEYLYFADEIEKRSMPETQDCPNAKCDASCERPENLTKFRVNCTACSGGDWCWLCNGPWNGGGFTICGNKECPSAEINEVLQNCPLKKATNEVDVPKIRACPKCLEFIEHSDACKHMHCHACGHDFCFSCLGAKADGKWPCGSYGYQCPVAPRQKLN